jgi:flagellar biosynthesis/type III secretory pathway protein FliH
MKYLHTFILLFLSLTLTACLSEADDPKTVADKYWQSLQQGNVNEAEKLVVQKNQQALLQHGNHITASSQFQNQNATSIVSTTITTTNPTTNQVHKQTFETVLVLVDGQWKVDAAQTNIPPPPTAQEEELKQLAADLNESMQENLESLDEAIEHGMHQFNEALSEGSKEMGDSLLQMMNKLNHSMKESIEKMKQRRQQQLQQPQQPQSQPDPDHGEGMI